MTETKFTKQHEWVRLEGEEAVVGITAHAAEQLGDVVFVELPELGKAVAQFKEAAVVESVKAASEVYAPLSGEISAVNEALVEEPAKVNESPEDAGWFLKIKPTNLDELAGLMDGAAYEAYLKELDQ